MKEFNDIKRDRDNLDKMAQSGNPPWKQNPGYLL